jgi:hypothetical protein
MTCITLTVPGDDGGGDGTPGTYSIDRLDAPFTVDEGEEFEIDTTVCCTGDCPEEDVTIRVGGRDVLNDRVDLADNCIRSAFDTTAVIQDPGEYEIRMTVGSAARNRYVTVEPVTQEPPQNGGDDGGDGGDVGDGGGDGGDGGADGPQFDQTALLLGGGAVAYYWLRNR